MQIAIVFKLAVEPKKFGNVSPELVLSTKSSKNLSEESLKKSINTNSERNKKINSNTKTPPIRRAIGKKLK